MRLSNVSWRIKAPIAFILAILMTEVVVTFVLASRARLDAIEDLKASARNLTGVFQQSLRSPLLREDLWTAYEFVSTPIKVSGASSPLKEVIVVDNQQRIFAPSDPTQYKVGVALSNYLNKLAFNAIDLSKVKAFEWFGPVGEERSLYLAVAPVATEDGVILGHVVAIYDGLIQKERTKRAVGEVAIWSLPGLAVLIPLGWLLGSQFARPLRQLAQNVSRVGRESPVSIIKDLPQRSNDEIGELSQQIEAMLEGLARKEELETSLVAAERLGALGRLSAAIAHEINNPLGGMLNAVDTARRHGKYDELSDRTLQLVGRGLDQIRTSLSALLVEIKPTDRLMQTIDWQDLRELIRPLAEQSRILLTWQAPQTESSNLPLPAQAIRQICLNLLLNACKAAAQGATDSETSAVSLEGAKQVQFRVQRQATYLEILVTNTGLEVPQYLRSRLFEPFGAPMPDHSEPRGMGLWVCAQLVKRLGGSIDFDSRMNFTAFQVRLPLQHSPSLS